MQPVISERVPALRAPKLMTARQVTKVKQAINMPPRVHERLLRLLKKVV